MEFHKGKSLIYEHHFSDMISIIVDYIKKNKIRTIASVGCDNMQIENLIMEKVPGLLITGFDPYGSNCELREFPKDFECDCVMVLYPNPNENGNYDIDAIRGREKYIVLYGSCGSSGSPALIKYMEDKPVAMRVIEGDGGKVGLGIGGITNELVLKPYHKKCITHKHEKSDSAIQHEAITMNFMLNVLMSMSTEG